MQRYVFWLVIMLLFNVSVQGAQEERELLPLNFEQSDYTEGGDEAAHRRGLKRVQAYMDDSYRVQQELLEYLQQFSILVVAAKNAHAADSAICHSRSSHYTFEQMLQHNSNYNEQSAALLHAVSVIDPRMVKGLLAKGAGTDIPLEQLLSLARKADYYPQLKYFWWDLCCCCSWSTNCCGLTGGTLRCMRYKRTIEAIRQAREGLKAGPSKQVMQ